LRKQSNDPIGSSIVPGRPQNVEEQAALSELGLEAWKAYLRSHARLTRELDAELQATQGYSLGDFDVLVQLADSPTGCLRMQELAAAVVLSPSGLSRRVDRLERAGLVLLARAADDARNVEATLSPAGKRLIARLRAAHRAGVKGRFADRYSEAELATLNRLLARLLED
jgi:DNA-binding MarR family transcriptional regulator